MKKIIFHSPQNIRQNVQCLVHLAQYNSHRMHVIFSSATYSPREDILARCSSLLRHTITFQNITNFAVESMSMWIPIVSPPKNGHTITGDVTAKWVVGQRRCFHTFSKFAYPFLVTKRCDEVGEEMSHPREIAILLYQFSKIVNLGK